MLLAALTLTALFALGIWLLRTGLHGRQIDQHPLCSHCGFDLHGSPTTSTRCPECGSYLNGIGTIKIGNRRRLPGRIGIGLLMLVPPLLAGSAFAWDTFNGQTAAQWAPDWLLSIEASAPVRALRDPALIELTKRIAAGNIGRPMIGGLVARGLAYQGDLSKPWVADWGDLIEAAHASGNLSNGDWVRYAQQAPAEFLFDVRPVIRRGDPIPFTLSNSPARVGHHSTLSAEIRLWVEGDRPILDPNLVIMDSFSQLSPVLVGGNSGITLPPGVARFAGIADGPNKLRIKADYSICDGPAFPRVAPVAHRIFHIEKAWQLNPADRLSVEPIDDESFRPAVEQALSVHGGIPIDEHARSAKPWSVMLCNGPGGAPVVLGDVHVERPPVPLAFEAYFKCGDREWPAGSVWFSPGQQINNFGLQTDHGDLSADRVDLILRPSAKVAAGSMNMTAFWNHEVVLKDVGVIRANIPSGPVAPAPTTGPGISVAKPPTTAAGQSR